MAFNPNNVDLDRLIKEQTQFIKGVSPVSVSKTPVQFSPAFEPTLSEMLRTGRPTDTSAIGQAARSEGAMAWEDMMNQILQAQAAAGGGGSTAQSGQLSRAGGDISSRISNEILRAGVAAQEAAAGRSSSALGDAVGSASVGLQGRGLDLEEAALHLTGRGQQADAGQALIDALLRGLPISSSPIAGTSSNIGVGNIRTPQGPGVAFSTPRPPKSMQEKLLDAFFASSGQISNIQSRGRQPGGGLSMSASQDALKLEEYRSVLANMLGASQTPASNAIQMATGLSGANAAMAGPAASLFAQSSQQQFLNDLAKRFGPAFAFGG